MNCRRGHDLDVEGYARKDGRGFNCRACAKHAELCRRGVISRDGVAPVRAARGSSTEGTGNEARLRAGARDIDDGGGGG